MRLGRILVSSVVRGSQQGNSHGGLYIVDLDGLSFEQVLDWNTCNISFEGRGADRGLRGISVLEENIYVAASDELFVFDSSFKVIASYRNPYLKHCHEIFQTDRKLYLVSTGFDSVLRFDLHEHRFDWATCLKPATFGVSAHPFDPCSKNGPRPGIALHLNNVHASSNGLYVAGRKLPALICLAGSQATIAARLPVGTHNAQPFRSGVIFNDTDANRLCWLNEQKSVSLAVPRYRDDDLINADLDQSDVARQAFGRGLCMLGGDIVAAGSSPSTVAVYDLGSEQLLSLVNLTMDVRNAVHGMAVWPFS